MRTDFPNYFIPAVLHHQGIPIDRAYEWRWFQRHKDYLQIDQTLVGFLPNPPMCAVPLLPLASLPPLSAKRVWLAFNLALLAISLWSLHRVTQLPWRRLLLLTFLCLVPLRDNFLYGQYYVVILALICLAFCSACRGHRFTSGALLAAAAWFKIFPAFFLILFLRKRNWRAAAGLIVTGALLGVLSIYLFGWNVHQVLFSEVLPRALHGDLVSPYVSQWNSFTALCHRFFLAEPELNPAPWIDSPALYSLAQAALATVLLFSFLFSAGDDDAPATTAWEWSAFVALLLLLSSMPSAYHHCVLIFTVIVVVDCLLKAGRRFSALAVTILFAIACAPLPRFIFVSLQGRMLSIFFLYLLLLFHAPKSKHRRLRPLGLAFAALFLAFLAFSNLRALRNRSEDFSRRIPRVSAGWGTFSAASSGGHLLLDEMVPEKYAAVILPDSRTQPMPAPGDVLAIAASAQSPFVYFELANQHSQIFRLPAAYLGRAGSVPEYVADGHDPAISPDGRWLAFLRDDGRGNSTIWMENHGSSEEESTKVAPAPGSPNLPIVLEMTVTPDGNLIAATGSPADPHLALLEPASGNVRALTEIPGPVRYPAISPDGRRLAFSRRESGAWHLFVRDLAGGAEQKLTSAACNAISPSWQDPQTLLYVTDCGRGLGLSAAARASLK